MHLDMFLCTATDMPSFVSFAARGRSLSGPQWPPLTLTPFNVCCSAATAGLAELTLRATSTHALLNEM